MSIYAVPPFPDAALDPTTRFCSMLVCDGMRANARIAFWAFLYTASAGLLIQKILLPYLLPSLHAGHGLMAGTDSVGFHAEAVQMADYIQIYGWRAWCLFPLRGSPVAIAALHYVFLPNEPWVLIGFNSIIHSLSFMTLVFLIEEFTRTRPAALFGAGLFLLMPSGATWYSQIHRDGYYILGVFIFTLGWVRIMGRYESKMLLARSVLLVVLGTAISYVARPAVSYMVLLSAIPICLIFLVRKVISDRGRIGFCWSEIVMVLVPLLLLWPLSKPHRDGVHQFPRSPQIWAPSPPSADPWSQTTLPRTLDSHLKNLALKRDGFSLAYPIGSNYIDQDVRFHSIRDLFAYIPRSLQIGLFAPFPNRWFDFDPSVARRVFRAMVSIEMLAFYLGLFSLILWGKQVFLSTSFWSAAWIQLVPIVMIGISINVIGAIHRYRFGNLSILACLGLGFAFRALVERRSSKRFSRRFWLLTRQAPA